VNELIIVIPCYNEPDLLRTVQSVFECERGNFCSEIIIVVNSYEISPQSIVEMNRQTYFDALEFAEINNCDSLKLTPLLFENLKGHQTGAGIPRKLGMDEAVRHFAGNSRGIIVSLDADCVVDKNYLIEIYRSFKEKNLDSATIKFHHPVEHLPENNRLRQATECYERYLHHYRDALEYCGYPYPFFTVGSAMAVTVDTYRRVGGMGRQQAGEDFYFLQKVFPLGKTAYIDTTCVYPAARLSDRVPFGTGLALGKMLREETIEKQTYSMEAFYALKQLFSQIELLYKAPNEKIAALINALPQFLQDFLISDNFTAKLEEINSHTASAENFRKRFFNYFNAFKIIKYLNFVHPKYLELEVC